MYRNIFDNCLRDCGYALLIIQNNALIKPYGLSKEINVEQEENIIERFLDDFGLKLVWYKYLSSTNIRCSMPNFGTFANDNLPPQKFLSPLLHQYAKQNYTSHYTLDDYVILARK